MRNPPAPYKNTGGLDYAKSGDGSLLSKGRQNFADGGPANKSSEDLKQLIADTGVDKNFKAAQSSSSSSSNNNIYGSNSYADDGSQWESQQPRYDKDGMPMRRVLKTPFGNVPLKNYAKGGVVKKRKVIMSTYAKSAQPKTSVKFAHGGPVFTSRSRFMKTPDIFRAPVGTERVDYDKKSKGGEMSCLTGDDKSLKPVKPRT